MTRGRHHVRYQVPGGPEVVADHREKIADVLRRAWFGAEPSDLETIMAWYSQHAIESENCRQGVCGDDHGV